MDGIAPAGRKWAGEWDENRFLRGPLRRFPTAILPEMIPSTAKFVKALGLFGWHFRSGGGFRPLEGLAHFHPFEHQQPGVPESLDAVFRFKVGLLDR